MWKLQRNAPSASAIVVRDGNVLLTRRARSPWKGYWETPGGYVELGEHPEAAIRRELLEELGVSVRSLVLLGVYVEAWTPGDWHQTTLYEVALVGGDNLLTINPDEVADYAWFAPDLLPDGMASTHAQRIHDWFASRRV